MVHHQLPCRRRKVRCDLGSVDEPGDPPCLRCRREKKDCVFSETRRKRKADEDGGDLDPEFVARNKRSSVGLGAAANGDALGESHGIGGIHVEEGRDSRMMTPSGTERDEAEASSLAKREPGNNKNRDVTNETAAALLWHPITQPGDALRMLVDAASHTETESRRESVKVAAGGGAGGGGTPTAPSHSRGPDESRTASASSHVRTSNGDRAVIDPQIVAMGNNISTPTPTTATTAPTATAAADTTNTTPPSPDLAAALQAWSSLRFVQAGWFTAREALAYIDYFYEHIAPLTPVSPPSFRDYGSHAKLLAEEPMLTITLLTIASRYKKLQGPGGVTRTTIMHDKLWEYLQSMITRMFWGQEQFGGGFCGAGMSRVASDPEARRRGLRSLGSVERYDARLVLLHLP